MDNGHETTRASRRGKGGGALPTVALAFSLALGGLALGILYGQNQHQRLGALSVGQPLPELVLASDRGPTGLLGAVSDEGLTLIVFHSPACAACIEDMQDIAQWIEGGHGATARVIVISERLSDREKYEKVGGKILWLADRDLVQSRMRLRIGAVPRYLVVDEDRRVVYLQRGRKLLRGRNVLLEELDRLILRRERGRR